MKKMFALFVVVPLIGCSGGGGNSDTAKGNDGNPAPTASEKAFEGKIQSFNVEFVTSLSGNLKGGPYMAYKFELDGNVVNKGDLNIYECQDSACSRKFVIYKMNCTFSWLTCRLTDGQGQDVKKGGDYKADAADVGDLQTAGDCRQFTNGAYQKCYYLTLVDPRLKQDGFYDQYFATEFVPAVGSKTDLNIFHLKR